MRILMIAAAALAVAGCQSRTTSNAPAPAPLSAPSAPVAAAAAQGGARGLMPAAARAWIECGLRQYYTAATPITAADAIDQCETEGRRYIDVYFAEYGFPSRIKNRNYPKLARQAARDLDALIKETPA